MQLDFSTLLNLVILGALIIAVAIALRLSKQLTNLKGDRAVIEELVANLNTAVDRAEIATENMKETAINSGDQLQDKINVARTSFDELQIVIEAGDSLANRLENAAQKRPALDASEDETDTKSKAERELLQAIKNKKETG